MGQRTVLSRVGDFLNYLRTRRKRRLYNQWVEMADLPRENIPLDEVSTQIMPEAEVRDESSPRLTTLYMMQGASLVLLCVILIILIIHSC